MVRKYRITISIVIVIIAILISLVFVFNRKDTKAYDDKLEQAQKYVEELDYKRAETAYLEAIKIDSKQPKAYLKLADVYVADGRRMRGLPGCRGDFLWWTKEPGPAVSAPLYKGACLPAK